MKKRGEKPNIDLEKLLLTVKNPFEGVLVVKVKEFTSMGSFDNPELHEGILIHSKYLIEDEPCSKVYTQSQLRHLVAALSPAATKLFVFMMYELEKNKPYVWINYSRYVREFKEGNELIADKNNKKKISINTYKKALNELDAKLIIKPVTGYKDTYWINPQVFWSGNRITSFPNRVVKRK